MKKIKYLLFCLITLIVFTSGVNALSERGQVISDALDEYTYEASYVDLSGEFTRLCASNNYEGCEDFQRQRFFAFLVRKDLDKYITLTNADAIDVFCYQEGDIIMGGNPPAESDYCEAFVMLNAMSEQGSETIVKRFDDITFNLVESPNTKIKSDIATKVKTLGSKISLADIDMVNHMVNYNSSNSTFFEGNNATREFSQIKKLVEENPDYKFIASFGDTRRGSTYAIAPEAFIYVEYNGVIYGYTSLNLYCYQVFFVPIGTKPEDYAKVVENRIKKYLNDNSIDVSVTKPTADELGESYYAKGDLGYDIEDLAKKTASEYYEIAKTNNTLETAKMGEGNSINTVVTAYTYKLVIDDQEMWIGVLPMDEETINTYGQVTSKDYNTGIILKTKSRSVPLDAMLNANKITLSKPQLTKIKSLGYGYLDSFDFSLFSSILDKEISKFNGDVQVLIPYKDSMKNASVVYVSDDGKTSEKYDSSIVTIDGIKYFVFLTNHFSSFALVSNVENPKTFDGITTSIIIVVISLLALVGLLIYLKKQDYCKNNV